MGQLLSPSYQKTDGYGIQSKVVSRECRPWAASPVLVTVMVMVMVTVMVMVMVMVMIMVMVMVMVMVMIMAMLMVVVLVPAMMMAMVMVIVMTLTHSLTHSLTRSLTRSLTPENQISTTTVNRQPSDHSKQTTGDVQFEQKSLTQHKCEVVFCHGLCGAHRRPRGNL